MREGTPNAASKDIIEEAATLVAADGVSQRNYPFVLSDTNSQEFSL